MTETLEMCTEKDDFEDVKHLKGGPVPKEEVIQNINDSTHFNIPVYKKAEFNGKTMLFCAGGPSLSQFVEEIRERQKKGDTVCTSNNTHDYLISQGIIPDICAVIDPKECVKNYIKNPNRGVKYLIGTCCNKQVAQNLIDVGMDVTLVLVAYGFEDGSEIKLQRELFKGISGKDFLVGGTMMGLRAMPLAVLMGFGKLDYYGFDSSFGPSLKPIYEDDPDFKKTVDENEGRIYEDADTKKKYTITEQGGFFYAYPKKRAEHLQVAQTKDGKSFWTSPAMAYQAEQLVYWVDRMEGKLDVTIHGDSLSSHLLNLHRAEMKRSIAAITDQRWTDEYQKMQKIMHEKGTYGKWGNYDLELVGRAILALYARLRRPITILDYGCGSGKLKEVLDTVFKAIEVTNYDPHIDKFSKEPEGMFDIVTCTDVMEHVEYPCVKNVLSHISKYIRYQAIFSVATEDATKSLPNGKNAHVTLRSVSWWNEIINRFCANPVETRYAKNGFVMIAQSFDAVEHYANEREEHKHAVEGGEEDEEGLADSQS